jgi:hypothetical protein
VCAQGPSRATIGIVCTSLAAFPALYGHAYSAEFVVWVCVVCFRSNAVVGTHTCEHCVHDVHHCGCQARTTRTSQRRVRWNVAPHRQCAPRGHLSAPTPLSVPGTARRAQAGRTSKRTATACLRARCGERVPKASLYPRMPQPPATQNVPGSVIAPAKNMNHGRQRRRRDASARSCPCAERGFV